MMRSRLRKKVNWVLNVDILDWRHQSGSRLAGAFYRSALYPIAARIDEHLVR